MLSIHERLGSTDKQMLWLDGMEHSLVRDPGRQVVFDAVAAFICGHATGSSPAGDAVPAGLDTIDAVTQESGDRSQIEFLIPLIPDA